MKYVLFVMFCILIGSQANAQVNREFKRLYKNGRVYQESKKIQLLRTATFKKTTYYDNGDVMLEEQWANNKRNGVTKVYLKNNQLLKEMTFRDDYMVNYVAYKNNQVYTKISADRAIIINKGRAISARWDKYYETRGVNRILAFDKKTLVDWMLKWTIPEQATQIFEDLASQYDSLSGSSGGSGGNDMLTCGGSTGLIDDLGVNFQSLGGRGKQSRVDVNSIAGGRNTKQSKQTALQVAGNIVTTCASNTKSKIGGANNVGGFNTQRNAGIKQAQNTLTNFINSCDSNRSGSDMFAIDTTFGFKSLQVLEEVLATDAAGATVVDATIVDGVVLDATALEVTAIEGIAGSTESAAVASRIGGFILTDVAVAATAVTVAAVVGYAVGTVINESVVGKALTEFIANAQESNDAELQKAVADAAAAQAKAETDRKKAENDAKQNAETNPQTDDSKATMPLPDGLGGGSACERAASFKAYCDSTNWRDLKCENFIRMTKGCKGNVTQMYVAGDGNVMDVGCPSDGDNDAIRAQIECKKKGMIGQPVPGESLCRSGNVDRTGIPNRDAGRIDPPREEFRDVFANTSINVFSNGDINATLNSSKPTLIVFMDPDCSACKEFVKTLKDSSMSNAFSTTNVQVIDATQSPELLQQYKIRYYPSYFVTKGGKKTPVTIGAMKPTDLKKFIANSVDNLK